MSVCLWTETFPRVSNDTKSCFSHADAAPVLSLFCDPNYVHIMTSTTTPQPRECSHGPVGDPPPRSIESPEVCRTRSSSGPFSIPDNAYRDSWLDSLWINLFSSRMSAALEREEFPAVRGTLGPESVDPVGRAGPRTTEAPGVTTAGGCGSETTPTRRYTPERTRASRTRFLFDGMGFGGAKRGGTRLGVNGGAVTTGAAGGDHYTYEEYVALAKRLQAGPPESQRQIVRGVLRSILPRWFPALYRTLFPPSKVSSFTRRSLCGSFLFFVFGGFACNSLRFNGYIFAYYWMEIGRMGEEKSVLVDLAPRRRYGNGAMASEV